jgi:hypothetical protein
LEVRCWAASANPSYYDSLSIQEVVRYRMYTLEAMPYDPHERDKRATRRSTGVDQRNNAACGAASSMHNCQQWLQERKLIAR